MALRGFKADRLGSDRPSMLDLLKATERDHGEAKTPPAYAGANAPPPSGIRQRRTNAQTNTGAETATPLGSLYCPPQSCRRGREDWFADD